MKKSIILISTLLAAGTLSAWADTTEVQLSATAVELSGASVGADTIYKLATDTSVTSLIQFGSGTTGNTTDPTFTGTIDGTGTLEMIFRCGDGAHKTFTVDLTGATFTDFSGKLAVVNLWNNNTTVNVSGNLSGAEYVFAGVTVEENWANARMYDNADRGIDILHLSGDTTFAGITGTSKDYSHTATSRDNSSTDYTFKTSSKEFITAGTTSAGTTATLSLTGTGTYSYNGTLGESGTEISLNVNMSNDDGLKGTQTFGGTNYLYNVEVTAGKLVLKGTTSIVGTTTVGENGNLSLVGTVDLSNSITNAGTLIIDANTIIDVASSMVSNGTVTIVSNTGTIDGWDAWIANAETNLTINGAALSARQSINTTSSTNGIVVIEGSAYNLYWKTGADFSGTTEWDRDSSGSGSTATFVAGDNIFFTTDATIAPSATRNIGILTVEEGATLTVADVSSSITNTQQYLVCNKTVIESGATLQLNNVSGSITNKNFSGTGTIVVNIGVTNHDTTMDLGEGNDFTGTLKWNGNLNPANLSNLNVGATLVLSGASNSLWSTSSSTSIAAKVLISGSYVGMLGNWTGTLTLGNGLEGDNASFSVLNSGSTLAVSGGKVTGTLSIAGAGTFSVGADATLEVDSLTFSGQGAVTVAGKTNATAITLSNGSLSFTGNTQKTVGTLTIASGLTVAMTHEGNTVNKLVLSGDSATLKFSNDSYNEKKVVIGALSGTGTLTLDSNANTAYNTVFVLGDSDNATTAEFTGTIDLKCTASNSARRVNVVIDDQNIAANAVINLASTTSTDTSSYLGLGVNASKVTIAGLTSTEGVAAHVFSGMPSLGATTYTGDGTVNELTINTAADGNYIYNGTIKGVALVKDGAGTQTIAGAIADYSTTTGFSTITVNAGTLVLTGTNTMTGAITVNGGTLDLTGTTFADRSTSVLTINGSTAKVVASDLARNSSGVGQISSYYTAATLVLANGGTLEVTAAQADGTEGAMRGFSVTSGTGTFLYSGEGESYLIQHTETTNTANCQIKLSSSSATVDFNVDKANANLIVSKVIEGAGALTKTGAGTLTLANANTYTGTTTVSAGTLRVESSTALGSTGTLTVDSGASVVLGTTLDKGAGVIFVEGSTFAIDLTTGNWATGASEGDSVALTIISASAIKHATGSDAASILGAEFFTSDTIASYFDSENSLLGAYEDYLQTWAYNDGTLTLTLTAIPEPSMFGLLAGVLALGLAGTRRRRKNAK